MCLLTDKRKGIDASLDSGYNSNTLLKVTLLRTAGRRAHSELGKLNEN